MAKRQKFVGLLAACGLAVGGLLPAMGPAGAQLGTIFGAPPRPPANVPSQQPAPAPLGLPQQMPPEEMDEDTIQPTPPPRAAIPQAPGTARTQPGAVRSQPLPPPPGAVATPPGATPPAATLQPGQTLPPIQPATAPPGQSLQAPRGTPQPANTTPQPSDEVITALPSQKIANPTAVFAGLDKITGRIISFEVALNEKVQFGALQVTPRVCYTRPPTESTNTDSFVEVDEVTLQGEVKRLFMGWMFATSPGLHAVEHPIYDVWLTDCKGGTTVISDAQPAAPQAAAPAQRPAAPRPPPPRQTPLTQQQPPLQQQQQPPPVPPPGFAVPRRQF